MSKVAAALQQPLRQGRIPAVIGTVAAAGLGIAIYSRTMRTAHADSGEPRKLITGPVFTSLPLASSEAVNHNTKRLRFQLPEGTISGFPTTYEPGVLELMVKHYTGGKASTHLHSLSPGDSLFFLARIPGFAYKPNQFPHVTLIAGGAGITPIYQLASSIIRDPSDKTRVDLVFGVNSDADVLMKEEFESWEKQYPDRFRATYVVSRPSESSPYPKGYVTKELLANVAGPAKPDSKVFVCGPPAMETALVGSWTQKGVLAELGYRKDQVHKF
ncbi:oxidoreductase NAD-binding domain-containing protein [Seiridium cupressi]